jgi:hypothetical protein
MRLLGYDMDQAVLRGDGELAVSLLWQAAQQPARDYRTAVLLRGQDGQIWSPAGTLRPRGYESPPPSRGWAAGSYVYDPHIVIPNPGAPPGEYAVVVALFDAATLAPAAPLDDAGQPSGTDWVVGHITLEPPAAPASLEALGVPPTAEPIPCGPVVLLDFSIDRAIGVPGDLVGVRWVWEAIATPDLALKPRLSLIGPGGESVQTWSLPAVADWWPTSRWTAGQRWAGRHVVRLPGGLESGRYTLHVAMKECVTPLGRVPLEVTAPSRAWSVPEALTPADAQFGGQIRLAGYDITPEDPAEGETVTVTLAWQAVASMETAYRIFVHLVDEAGTLVAQDDGEPAGWSRPTTGWAVGEVVVEERRLALPAEAQRMTLRVGVYAPDGARLPVGDDGDDTVTIGMISVND